MPFNFWDENNKSIRIKVCNIKSIETGYNLFRLGVHALGFHIKDADKFEEELQLCSSIIPVLKLHTEVSCWVLTDIYDKEIVSRILENTKADSIQLQGRITSALFTDLAIKIKDKYNVKVIKTASVSDGAFNENKDLINEYSINADAILIDTKWQKGGTGELYDYGQTKKIIEQLHKPVIIAGGLNSGNVCNAINVLNPFCVDVQSGVEEILLDTNKGKHRIKDFNKVKLFVENCNII